MSQAKPQHFLSAIYPSQDMMDFVEAIIAREQQKPSHEQTAKRPTSGEKNYLSPSFPSKEMEKYVMNIVRKLE